MFKIQLPPSATPAALTTNVNNNFIMKILEIQTLESFLTFLFLWQLISNPTADFTSFTFEIYQDSVHIPHLSTSDNTTMLIQSIIISDWIIAKAPNCFSHLKPYPFEFILNKTYRVKTLKTLI